jgi:hypothetical protein
MSDPVVVGSVRKNSLEEVRVSISEFRGHNLVDVRVFADFDGRGGEPRPTKKGIALKVELLPDLIAALQAAQEAGAR